MNGTNLTALFAPGGGLEVVGQPTPLGGNQVVTTITALFPDRGSMAISSAPENFTIPEGEEHRGLVVLHTLTESSVP
jgi:hypothetical protein